MLKPIRTLHDYRLALKELVKLMDAPAKSADAKQAALLYILLGDFERRYFPVLPPDPLDAIRYRMNQLGLVQRDMVPYFGSESRASEVLRRQRKLTVKMIAALHYGLGIPLPSLIALTPGLARRLGKLRHDPVARLASLRLQLEPKRKPGRPKMSEKRAAVPRKKKGSLATVTAGALPAPDEKKRLRELIRLWHSMEETNKVVRKLSPGKKRKNAVKTPGGKNRKRAK